MSKPTEEQIRIRAQEIWEENHRRPVEMMNFGFRRKKN